MSMALITIQPAPQSIYLFCSHVSPICLQAVDLDCLDPPHNSLVPGTVLVYSKRSENIWAMSTVATSLEQPEEFGNTGQDLDRFTACPLSCSLHCPGSYKPSISIPIFLLIASLSANPHPCPCHPQGLEHSSPVCLANSSSS